MARHGRRSPRSAATGPAAPARVTELGSFVEQLAQAAEFARELFPYDLAEVRFTWADLPQVVDDRVPRWHIDRERGEIRIYRLPVRRLGDRRAPDLADEQLRVLPTVLRAAAEYVGVPPEDLGEEFDRD